MSVALGALRTITAGTWFDDVVSFGNGVADGYILSGIPSGVWIVLVKDVLILAVDKLVMPLPRGLVHSSEAILGFILGILLAPKRR